MSKSFLIVRNRLCGLSNLSDGDELCVRTTKTGSCSVMPRTQIIRQNTQESNMDLSRAPLSILSPSKRAMKRKDPMPSCHPLKKRILANHRNTQLDQENSVAKQQQPVSLSNLAVSSQDRTWTSQIFPLSPVSDASQPRTPSPPSSGLTGEQSLKISGKERAR